MSKAATQQNGIAPLRVIMVPGGLITTAPLLTPDDVEAAARYVRCAPSTGEQIEREIRVQFEDAAIRIGNIPAGFPRELLHRYIFGNYDTLYLTPDEFIHCTRLQHSGPPVLRGDDLVRAGIAGRGG